MRRSSLEILITYLPALVCLAAMVVCLRMMSGHRATTDDAEQHELLELRRRVAQLERESTATPTEERTHG
jgi:hypothetical protein